MTDGTSNFVRTGTQVLTGHLDGDGFAAKHQIDRALNGDHRQRFPGAAIEEQDAALQNAYSGHFG